MITESVKPPKWFMVIAVIFLLWNLMGVFEFLMYTMMSEEMLQQMDEIDRNIYMQQPMWTIVAFGVATITAALASLGLTLRKKWSHYLFLVSLLAVLVNMYYTFFVMDIVGLKGATASIMPVAVIVIAVFLLWFSYHSIQKKWIN